MLGTSKSFCSNSRNRAWRCCGGTLGPRTSMALAPSEPTKARGSADTWARGAAAKIVRTRMTAPVAATRRIIRGNPPLARRSRIDDRRPRRVAPGPETGVRQVRIFVTNLRRPPLAVKRADRRIIIQRGTLDIRQALDVARPGVDAFRHRAPQRGIVFMIARGDLAARIGEAVADHADGIAHVRRAEHREHQIGPRI